MEEKILAHRRGCTALVYGVYIFIGCFGFPLYNFTRRFDSWWINILSVCICCYEAGTLQGVLYGSKAAGRAVAVGFGATLLGFACRFFLEFGEVSNSYNFTLPNIMLHLFATVCISVLAACFTGKRR